MGKKILHLQPPLLSEKCRAGSGTDQGLAFPQWCFGSSKHLQQNPLPSCASCQDSSNSRCQRSEMGTSSDPPCLRASRLLRRLVNMQTSRKWERAGKWALCQRLCIQVETDAANMVYINKAHKWCNLQQIHLLPGCISKVLNALAEKLNYFR